MNKVVHFEIVADDVERAQKFYREIFDWKINAVPSMGYTLLHTGPTSEDGMPQEHSFINGGMMKRNDTVKNPVITVEVDSIDETAKKIIAAGGTIVGEKREVSDMGFSAYFKDSEGNVLGLWENVK